MIIKEDYYIWTVISWNSYQQEIASFADRTEMLEYVGELPRNRKIKIRYEES